MSKAFILIPGARLPAASARPLLEELPADAQTALERIGVGAGEAVSQVLDVECYRRAPHLTWLWRVITRRTTTPHEAPWRWLSMGGRQQAPELWCLTPLTIEEGRVAAETPALTQDEFLPLTFALEGLFLKAGLRMQIWDTTWFLTRRDDWAVTTAPRMALTGRALEDAPIRGPAAEDVRSLLAAVRDVLQDHPVNDARRKAGKPTIDALWISGGGHEELFFPPTLIRSVAANAEAVRGWANAAGILQERLGTDKGVWPDAPQGDVIAVIDDLYTPWLQADWKAWADALPTVAKKIDAYREDAQRFDATEILIVAFGETGAVTLAPAETGLMDRLFGRKHNLSAEAWCPDLYDGVPA